MTENLKLLISLLFYVSTEQVSWDDERNGDDDSSNGQLPRPQVALKEEEYGREQGGYDAANDFSTEMQDDTRHEAAHADK